MLLEYKSLEYKGKIVFEKMIMGHFKRAPKPYQENEACFMYLQEGAFQFRTPDKVFKMREGDAVLAKCGNYFFEQSNEDRVNFSQSSGIGAYLYPDVIKELFDFDLSISDFQTNYGATNINIDGILKNFMESIDFLLDNPAICDDAMLKVKLQEFILLLSKSDNAPSLLDFISALFKPHEYDFRRIIEKNIFSTLSTLELSQLCGMSVSTFQRTFNELYQQTPAKYILEQRMLKAKEMLLDTSMRISEIAYDCGFQSTSTFNRSFKNHYKLSPSDYRLNKIGQ